MTKEQYKEQLRRERKAGFIFLISFLMVTVPLLYYKKPFIKDADYDFLFHHPHVYYALIIWMAGSLSLIIAGLYLCSENIKKADIFVNEKFLMNLTEMGEKSKNEQRGFTASTGN